MRRLLVLLLAAASLSAQQPPDESNVPAEEKRIPPGHYCKAKDVPISPREKNAHHCDCKMVCDFDQDGNQTGERTSNDCMSWCELNGRKCTCHVEQPCPGTFAGRALRDMHGTVVAVAHRHH
jgi:hypothetical protein